MGKVNQGILGHLSGSVGYVTGASVKGVPTLRRKSSGGVNPRTEQQVEVRTAFGEASEYCRVNREAIMEQEKFKEKKGLTIWNQMMRWYQAGGRLRPQSDHWEPDDSGSTPVLRYKNFDIVQSNGVDAIKLDMSDLPTGFGVEFKNASGYVWEGGYSRCSLSGRPQVIDDSTVHYVPACQHATSETLLLYTGMVMKLPAKMTDGSTWHAGEDIFVEIATGDTATTRGAATIVNECECPFESPFGQTVENIGNMRIYTMEIDPWNYHQIPQLQLSLKSGFSIENFLKAKELMHSWGEGAPTITSPVPMAFSTTPFSVFVTFGRGMTKPETLHWDWYKITYFGYELKKRGVFERMPTRFGFKWANYYEEDYRDTDVQGLAGQWLNVNRTTIRLIADKYYCQSASHPAAMDEEGQLIFVADEFRHGDRADGSKTMKLRVYNTDTNQLVDEVELQQPSDLDDTIVFTGVGYDAWKNRFNSHEFAICLDVWGKSSINEPLDGAMSWIYGDIFFE